MVYRGRGRDWREALAFACLPLFVGSAGAAFAAQRFASPVEVSFVRTLFTDLHVRFRNPAFTAMYLDLVGELLNLARVVQEPLWVHAQQDHDRRGEGGDDVGDGPDWAVGAEVGDPPAAAAQGDPEGQQAEFVLFARYAGKDGARTLALAPALGKAKEASSDEVGGEVLLGDRHLAGLPPFPQPVQVRKYEIPQDGLDGVGREEPVQGGVGSLLIQPVE